MISLSACLNFPDFSVAGMGTFRVLAAVATHRQGKPKADLKCVNVTSKKRKWKWRNDIEMQMLSNLASDRWDL